MKPETRAHLDKARLCLAKARAEFAGIGAEPALVEDVARNTYYAAFHAAQALIFERTGNNSKTHAGVHRQFHRLSRSESTITRELRTFLNKAYDFKAIADYDTVSTGKITSQQASAAIITSERFLAVISELLLP